MSETALAFSFLLLELNKKGASGGWGVLLGIRKLPTWQWGQVVNHDKQALL